jgi:hypothetical protein
MWLKIKPLTKHSLGILCPLLSATKRNGISEYPKSILETLKGLQRKTYPVFSRMYNVPTILYDFVRACLLKKGKKMHNWCVHADLNYCLNFFLRILLRTKTIHVLL